jgi:hypothetical protein
MESRQAPLLQHWTTFPSGHAPHGEFLVVMTCTVDPSTGWAPPRRRDPRQRLGDYLEALRFWLAHPDPRLARILLVENSGEPLVPFIEMVRSANHLGKAVELLSYDGNDYPPGIHYGYSELGMLEQAIDASMLCRRSRHFIKVTGRLVFPRIAELLDTLPETLLFAVDSRVPLRQRADRSAHVASQLLVFSVAFWTEHLRGATRLFSPAMTHLEQVVYHTCLPHRRRDGAIMRWSVSCEPAGISAYLDESYRSPKYRTKALLRSAVRKLAPALWI